MADFMSELIKLLKEYKPETINECIIVHLDKETEQVQSISPLVKARSMDELFTKLSNTRDAIQGFLNELVNKKLIDNGQGN